MYSTICCLYSSHLGIRWPYSANVSLHVELQVLSPSHRSLNVSHASQKNILNWKSIIDFPAIFIAHLKCVFQPFSVCTFVEFAPPKICSVWNRAHAQRTPARYPYTTNFFFANSAGISFTSNAQRWKDISATAPTPSLLVSSIIVAPIEDSAFFFCQNGCTKNYEFFITANVSLPIIYRNVVRLLCEYVFGCTFITQKGWCCNN